MTRESRASGGGRGSEVSQKKLMLVVEDGSRSKAKAKAKAKGMRAAEPHQTRQERPSYPRSWRFWLADDEERHVKAV